MTLPDRVSDLYHRALECAPDKRTAVLDQACAGDAALRAEVESRLRYDAASFLEGAAAVAGAGGPAGTDLVNRQLGVYGILAPLGVSGMGEVHRARDTRRLNGSVAIEDPAVTPDVRSRASRSICARSAHARDPQSPAHRRDLRTRGIQGRDTPCGRAGWEGRDSVPLAASEASRRATPNRPTPRARPQAE